MAEQRSVAAQLAEQGYSQPMTSIKDMSYLTPMGKREPFGEWDWLPCLDGDARALGIMRRHYSWREYKDGRPHRLFVGPGEKMVLLTQNCKALFTWRKFKDDSGQEGVNCAAFHNSRGGCDKPEHPHCSSNLIRRADDLAWERWPGERLYTYVNPKKIRGKEPGRCFIEAGWRRCGETKGGLVILEMLRGDADG